MHVNLFISRSLLSKSAVRQDPPHPEDLPPVLSGGGVSPDRKAVPSEEGSDLPPDFLRGSQQTPTSTQGGSGIKGPAGTAAGAPRAHGDVWVSNDPFGLSYAFENCVPMKRTWPNNQFVGARRSQPHWNFQPQRKPEPTPQTYLVPESRVTGVVPRGPTRVTRLVHWSPPPNQNALQQVLMQNAGRRNAIVPAPRTVGGLQPPPECQCIEPLKGGASPPAWQEHL